MEITGFHLSNVILDQLTELCILGYAYDNGVNIEGRKPVVQVHLLQLNL